MNTSDPDTEMACAGRLEPDGCVDVLNLLDLVANWGKQPRRPAGAGGCAGCGYRARDEGSQESASRLGEKWFFDM
jgi:hypothetical protein